MGAYSLATLSWREVRKELIIAARVGSFPEMVTSREFQLVFISRLGRETKTIHYTLSEIKFSLP